MTNAFSECLSRLTKRLALFAALGILVPLVLLAQQPAAQSQAPPTVAGAIVNRYSSVERDIIRSGDKMPEEFYGLRPGTQEEVRTFGQHLAHVANFNYLWCAQAKGEKNPNAGINLEKTLTTKDQFMKALRASFDYCDGAYNGLTDAAGSEVITITQENGRQTKQTRAGLLILNVAHEEELYGSIVTTLRIKNIVPPSSEPRTPQQQPQQQQRMQ